MRLPLVLPVLSCLVAACGGVVDPESFGAAVTNPIIGEPMPPEPPPPGISEAVNLDILESGLRLALHGTQVQLTTFEHDATLPQITYQERDTVCTATSGERSQCRAECHDEIGQAAIDRCLAECD